MMESKYLPLYWLFAHLCDGLGRPSKRCGGDDADGPAPVSCGFQLLVCYLNHTIGHLETDQKKNTAEEDHTQKTDTEIYS